MKIDQIGLLGQTPGEGPDKKVKVTGPSFQSELKKVLDSEKTSSVSSTSKTSSTVDPSKVGFNKEITSLGSETKVVQSSAMDLTYGILDDLESFQNTLGNPNQPLVRVRELMEKISLKKNFLLDLLPNLDGELAGIAKETALLVNTESSKFYREYQI